MSTSRVRRAIDSTDRGYWQTLLTMRCEFYGHKHGRDIPGVTSAELSHLLKSAEWEPFIHPHVINGCTAFRTLLAGRTGVIDLRTVSPQIPVKLVDPKRSGRVSAEVSEVDSSVDFTIISFGPDLYSEEKALSEAETVWTFYPGPPGKRSIITSFKLGGKNVTAQEAIEIGLIYAKVV